MFEWDRTDYDRDRYMRRRQELLSIIGEKCVACGSMDRIEFDHVDPASKEFALMGRWNRPLEELLAEAAKCQPLCRTCHTEKSRAARTIPHGGGTSGRKGCKCQPCKGRKAEYMREWRKGKPRKKATS